MRVEIIDGGGWEPNDLNIDFREFREYVFERNVIKNNVAIINRVGGNVSIIDSYVPNIDFREFREYVSYSNTFIEHMSLDELRQFKNEIWWFQDFIKQLAKRNDFKKICEQFREEIREIYEKWGTEIDWDDFTEGKEWKEYLRI